MEKLRNLTSALVLSLVFPGVSVMAGQDKSTADAKAYVDQLPANCSYDHGYLCPDIEEDNFLSVDSQAAMIPARYLSAWQLAYRDFLAIEELSDQQKDLKHYRIGFTENETDIVILFQALLLPEVDNGKMTGVLRSTYGQSMKYWLRKDGDEIRDRKYLR